MTNKNEKATENQELAESQLENVQGGLIGDDIGIPRGGERAGFKSGAGLQETFSKPIGTGPTKMESVDDDE